MIFRDPAMSMQIRSPAKIDFFRPESDKIDPPSQTMTFNYYGIYLKNIYQMFVYSTEIERRVHWNAQISKPKGDIFHDVTSQSEDIKTIELDGNNTRSFWDPDYQKSWYYDVELKMWGYKKVEYIDMRRKEFKITNLFIYETKGLTKKQIEARKVLFETKMKTPHRYGDFVESVEKIGFTPLRGVYKKTPTIEYTSKELF